MDYPFYFILCPDELELRRSLVVPDFVQSDHFPNSTLTKKTFENTAGEVQVHLWVKKPDEHDTAKFFNTMIPDGAIVDAWADKTMKQNAWFTRNKLHSMT